MIYIEYVEYKEKYYAAQREYDKVLSEKEELFIKTQPSAVPTDKEVVSGGKPSNAFDSYLIVKETKRIDERLEEARSILKDRERLLNLKEEELRHSQDWYNKIYAYRYIDKLSVTKIEMRVPYSRAQIFRILRNIRKNINMRQNETLQSIQ